MKNMINCIFASVAIVSAVAFGAADDRLVQKTESAIRAVVTQMDEKIKSAKALDNKPLYLFVLGKHKAENTLCERFIQESLVKNGKVSVLADDDSDERLKRVLNHMEKSFVDQNGGVGAFQRETAAANELGHLLNAQILLEAHLDIKTNGNNKRVSASLQLMAYEIRTKRYVWIASVPEGSGTLSPIIEDDKSEDARLTKAAVNVFVRAFPTDPDSAAIAQAIAGDVSGALAKRGYTMQGTARKPDVTLELRISRTAYDKMGNFRVFNGSINAKARLNGFNGTPGRDLGARSFDARSTRGLGVAEAEKSLVDKFVPMVDEWADGVILPEALNLHTETVVLRFAEKDNDAVALSAMEQLRRGVEALRGVRRFEVMSKTLNNGVVTATFRAVYARDSYRGGIMAAAFKEKPELANLLLTD